MARFTSVAACVGLAGGLGCAGLALAGDESPKVGMIEIEGAVTDAPGPFDWLAPEETTTLRGLIDALHAAAADNNQAILIRLKDATLSFSQIEELGAAIGQIRQGGVPVHVFDEAFDTPGLLLGSYADQILVQDGGAVALSGLYMEEMFLAETLDWIGMRADLIQVGAYKGANEQLTRSEPSPEWDRNIGQLLDSLYTNIRQTLKTNRGLSDEQLDSAMGRIWFTKAQDAADAGLVDQPIDLPALGAVLAASLGADDVTFENGYTGGQAAMPSDPFAIFRMLSSEPDHSPDEPTIAIVHINGPIVDGDSSAGGLFGSAGSVGSRTIRNALEDILAEDLIKGVIVRIDSPGGSATASDVIWQGLRRVAEQKPVWASVGSMAASGGYYIAVGADRIYANPSSVVGSIGVVGGKISMGGLYDRLHVNVTPRARGPQATLWDSTRPWTESERALVERTMRETYDLFTSRVTAGREGIDLDKTAEGRLFTGSKAVSLRMIDQVGGLELALADMAEELGLQTFDVMDYPGPKPLAEIFEGMLGVRSPLAEAPHAGLGSPSLAAARTLLGEQAWSQISQGMDTMLRFRSEPVQLVMPRVLIFRNGAHAP